MKQISDLRFPYPFLQEDGGDYINSKFIIDFEMTKVDEQLELKCSYELVCPLIEKMIENGDAIAVVHIEQRTYRNVFKLVKDKTITISLDKLSPNYNVEIVGMIIATKKISFAYDSSINEIFQYFDSEFNCDKMAILGYSNFAEFELPQESRISSIFTISEYKDPTDISKGDPFKIDLDGNVIDIKVLPKIKENFVDLRTRESSHNKLLNSVFVYPAIEIAIMEMFTNYDLYKDYKWCISIANKISNAKECSFEVLLNGNKSIDKDELIEYTHIILEDLLLSSFTDAMGMED